MGNDQTPVAVLGLGPMGTALATALIHNGHPTTVWNRTAAKAKPLVELGAVHAAEPAQAASSPVVIVNVMDYTAVRDVITPIATELKGRTLINLTAGSPQAVREMAQWAAENGIDYLDGAILTPAETIGTPAASILYSGPSALYEQHKPVLDVLASGSRHLDEDHSRAAAYEAALLDAFWTGMHALTHAFALAGLEGVTARQVSPYLQGVLGLLPGIAEEYAEFLDNEDYTHDRSSVRSSAAAMEHIIEAAAGHGLDTSVLRGAKAVADRAIAAGHGDESIARITYQLRQDAAA